ncbi:MAG: NifU family protein [Candidatus Aureabacteria bacterium]|nr:NifU family protein [Candidatus Auribacterota bacterium]
MTEHEKTDSTKLSEIEALLDKSIRPALQNDGGDLEVVGYDEKNKVLSIHYQGACGCCAHATMGTLMAIQNVLKKEWDPQIKVVPV